MKCLAAALLLTTVTSTAQQNPYKFRAEIDSIILQDTMPWRFQLAATDLSFIGEYSHSLKVWDEPRKASRRTLSQEYKDSLAAAAREIIKDYEKVDAVELILEQASKTGILIINEAHHNPTHRAFLRSLLPELRKLGYRYLGLEALDAKDSLINSRKYPLKKSGYYTVEPNFGNLIRSALQLDYEVFGYETTRNMNGKQREIDQAENIYRFMQSKPDAKLIIFCGYDHALEDTMRNGWEWAMAGRLKAMTGVDPLTIDQVALTESLTNQDATLFHESENVYRHLINADKPVVLSAANGKIFGSASPGKRFDIQVYHPNTVFKAGRPGWMMGPLDRTVEIVDKISIEFPVQLAVFSALEPLEQAVPVDLIEIASPQNRKTLIIPKNGIYQIQIRNAQGERQSIRVED